ncbi:hypothetical protein RN001_008568 [Aquatica leii]|uniref:Transglutaminase-like domain-containing protein n=1 Tax=Aquatica leii TaxID=1421715 RepID=A0AAN7P9S8_9COLE|nr:hypothetical protein RN001_008568 [Aquatica leii]
MFAQKEILTSGVLSDCGRRIVWLAQKQSETSLSSVEAEYRVALYKMEPINVTSITFYPREDAKRHRTDEYDLISIAETPTAIYRRGLNFKFDVNFDRPFNEQLDVVRISFSFGPNANVTKGTRVVLPMLHLQKEIPKMNRWNLAFKGKTNNTVHLQVHVPALAQVGIWFCSIQTNISGCRDKRSDFKFDDEIYIIFNPWSREDSVYMPKTSDLNEYIMNETGKVWVGSFNNPKSKKWIFGQFDEIVLPAAVFLLEKSDLPHSDRGSPILVARAISALINANDDDGLLVGKWDGEYSDGTSPFDWTGSTAIMDEYFRNGGQPVKYGQCWVYSAATVSICRTLGIPCRSVTNYISAHDTNRSLTVDKFFDIFGELIENGPQGDCNDTCWNFHVWNDVWMNRPDLPKGYGGWQIIDGTPQELSGSIYCCGPASVEAVKNGEVGFLYDTPFVFSEVNADICHYQEDEESEWGFSRLSINRYHVGRKILTKHPDLNDDVGDSDMFDVTSIYKHPEGSEAEKLAVASAIKGVTKAQEHYSVPPKTVDDVFFDLIDIDTVPFGEDFYVEVHIKNNSRQSRSITTNLSATSVYYTGATAERLKAARGSFVVNPGKTEIIKLKVNLSEYMYKLVDHNLIKIYAIANVKETRQSWCEEDDFVLTKPELNIKVDKDVRVGQTATAVITFSNPIHIPLTNCKYTIEGHGLIRPKTVDFRDVNPNETVTFKETFVPTLSKQRTLVCTFSSKQVEGIQGSTSFTVS